ncbi:MAG: methyl-accepting chemotaxis protein [Synechococcus sp.]
MTQAPQKPNTTQSDLERSNRQLSGNIADSMSVSREFSQASPERPETSAVMYRAVAPDNEKIGGTLRSRLLLTLVPTVLLPLGLLGGINIWNAQQEAYETLEEKLEGQAELATEIADNAMETALITPETIAQNPLVIDAARSASQKAEADGLPQLSIDDVEARFASSKLLSPNQRLNDYLVSVAESSGLAEVFFTERNGYNVAFSNATSDFVQSDEGWWQQGKADIQWVDTPEFDESAGTFSIDMIQAITDPDSGEVLGVMKAVLPAAALDVVADYLDESGITGSTQIDLVDLRSAKALASINAEGTRTGDEVEIDPILVEVATFIREAYEAAEAAGTEVDTSLLVENLSSQFPIMDVSIDVEGDEAGEIEFREETIPTVSFHYNQKHHSLSLASDLPWAALASLDQSEFTSASAKETRNLLIEMAVLSALAIAVILWLSNQVSQPLAALARIAGKAAAGDYDVEAEPTGTSETQTLAGSFNNLVTQVREQLRQQELTVQQTQLLAQLGSERVTESDELSAFFNMALNQTRQMMKADRTVIYRFNPDWSGYISNESVAQGWPVALNDSIEDACIPQELIDAYLNDRVVPTSDVYNAGFHPDHLKLMDRLQIKANLVVPILNQGQLYGILVAHHCAKTHEWTEAEIGYMRQLALLFGANLDRVASFQQQQQAAEEQQQAKEFLQKRALELLVEVDPVSQGDLTVRANVTEDEIGTIADSYNATIRSLRQLVETVQSASSEVNSTTGQNEASVRELSQEARLQAQNIADALERIQAMSESIRTVASNAEKAEAAVKQATATVEEGDLAMNQTVEGFQSIRETVAETSKKVKRLGESSQAISKVVNLIENFAAQTNLLALNASIEAARAGEQGRGFAVVAEEVRSLAQQSSEATAEIEKLVAEIQTETQEVAAAMEAGTEQVVAGTQLVDRTRQSLIDIAAASSEIDQLVASIAEATTLQNRDSEAVGQTMTAVAEIADKTATSATDVSDSFKRLLEVTETLESNIGQFKLS